MTIRRIQSDVYDAIAEAVNPRPQIDQNKSETFCSRRRYSRGAGNTGVNALEPNDAKRGYDGRGPARICRRRA